MASLHARPPLHIALYGQYKTGTTALFYKVKQGLPPDARTLFEEPRYTPENGDEARWLLAKVILSMDESALHVDLSSFRMFHRHVLLVRDPRDWLISGLLFLPQQAEAIYSNPARLEQVLELMRRKERDPAGLPVHRMIEAIGEGVWSAAPERVSAWIAAQKDWFTRFERAIGPHFLLRYEELVDGAVEALSAYLGIALTGEPAEVPGDHSHVTRTRSYGGWRHWFTPQDVNLYSPLMQGFLDKYGYDMSWELDPAPRILPEHCSEYVRRTVARRRARARGAPS